MVSGLPGAGKTTVATALAHELGLPLIDKDDLLEALFEGFQAVDLELRQTLSRDSDRVLARTAQASRGAVLVSFWRRPGAEGGAGTPCDWIAELSEAVVEVFCDCPPAVAERRFRARRRHRGHHDRARLAELGPQLRALAAQGPLGIGALVRVDTEAPVDPAVLAAEVRTQLSRAGAVALED